MGDDYKKTEGNITSVKGNDRTFVQDAKADSVPYGIPDEDTGLFVGDSTGKLIVQRSENGGTIIIEGDNVRNNYVVQWDGGHNTVRMKDGEGITGNRFAAGFEEGLKYTVGKMIDFVEQPIGKMLGMHPLRRLEDDTIVLPGKREDYDFKFNNDANKMFAIYSGTVDITHRATGATNNFANFEYVIFGGKENETDRSKYVELSKIKAEQKAMEAVQETRGQIAPASTTAPQQLPAAKGKEGDLQTGANHDRHRS